MMRGIHVVMGMGMEHFVSVLLCCILSHSLTHSRSYVLY